MPGGSWANQSQSSMARTNSSIPNYLIQPFQCEEIPLLTKQTEAFQYVCLWREVVTQKSQIYNFVSLRPNCLDAEKPL